jgi:hypothetical protein
MGARPYDPTIGRFYAPDPIEGGALNNYDYALQDPVNLFDLERRAVCEGPDTPCGGSAGVAPSHGGYRASPSGGRQPHTVGRWGERAAADRLRARGWDVLGGGQITIRTPVGTTGVDIVATKNGRILRSQDGFRAPHPQPGSGVQPRSGGGRHGSRFACGRGRNRGQSWRDSSRRASPNVRMA